MQYSLSSHLDVLARPRFVIDFVGEAVLFDGELRVACRAGGINPYVCGMAHEQQIDTLVAAELS